MTERVNLVDAYDNRSVVAKLVSMEERISGAESSIEKTVEDGEKSIDTKVDTGVTKINSLLTGLDDTIAKAEAAASTAETASTKAETAAKLVDEDITAANNAVLDAQGYATTGKLHDGTVVASADSIAKSCETFADQASKAMSQAQTAAAAASAGATNAKTSEANAKKSETNASTYLDTVKASADAAKTSADAAAQSATEADAAAASIDASNLVTLTTEQTIDGLKDFTNTGNILRAASRTTSVKATDVINSGDLAAINGKYNNLMHRTFLTGVEPAYGKRAFSLVDISQQNGAHTMEVSSPSKYYMTLGSEYTINYDYYKDKKCRMLFTIRSPIGYAVVEAFMKFVLDKTSGSANYFHMEVYSSNVLENTMKCVDASIFKMFFTAYSTYRNPEMYLAFGYDGAVIYGLPFSVEAFIAPCFPTTVGSSIYLSNIAWTTHEYKMIPTGSSYHSAGEISIPITTYTIPEESE